MEGSPAVVTWRRLLPLSAAALLCAGAEANPHAKLGRYQPVSDVLEQAQLAYDIKAIANATEAHDFAAASRIYEAGRYSCVNSATPRSLRSFVSKATASEDLRGGAFFDSFTNGTGPDGTLGPIPGVGRLDLPLDFWDVLVSSALNGSGSFAGKSNASRAVAVQKGILGAVMAFVARELEAAIAQAVAGSVDDGAGSPHSWDQAWAFYHAAAWEAVEEQDADYAYDGWGGVNGTVEAGATILAYFLEGQRASRRTSLDAAALVRARDNIYRAFTLIAVRAALKYSYNMNTGEALEDESLNEIFQMQAYLGFLAVAGWVEQARPRAAARVLELLDPRQVARLVPTSLHCELQIVLIRAYEPLGLDCAKIGRDKAMPSSMRCDHLPPCPATPELPEGLPNYDPGSTHTLAGTNIDCGYSFPKTVAPAVPIPMLFEPVDGGVDKACRGANASDDAASFYSVYLGAPSLGSCKSLCMDQPECRGIEHAPGLEGGRCEVWTRSEGIGASVGRLGVSCFSYVPDSFEPVDGGNDRLCRGAAPDDNAESYYTLFTGTPSLEACRSLCTAEPMCKGFEYIADQDGRCEVWTREAGVQASAGLSGATCFRRTGLALGPRGR